MDELQVITIITGSVILTGAAMYAAIEMLRAKVKEQRRELRQMKAENARLRSLLQLSGTERDILMGQMELAGEKHREAVALMAQEAGERCRTKDMLLRQKWAASVNETA